MSPTMLPTPEDLAKAYKIEVFDASGKSISFGNLVQDQETIVVFIRHFFCGSCQAYVSQLASVRSEALQNAHKKLVVIGCGDYQPIKHYSENAGYTEPIYADPSRALHQIFNLIENLKLTPNDQPKKSYLANRSYWGNVFSSIWSGPMKNPGSIGKQGNISQLGGEFIFGPGEQCSYASRMEHTEDHVEVADLMKEAGVEYP